MTIRVNPVCAELIKLERKSVPGCTSDGEAVESMIFRASTSPEARQLITQAAEREPLFAAAQLAWELEHKTGRPGFSSPNPQRPIASGTPSDGPRPGDAPGDLARRYASAEFGSAKKTKAPTNAAPASSAPHSTSRKSQT